MEQSESELESGDGISQLELITTIGFEGKLKSGLKVHPDRVHLVYGLGNTVVIKDMLKNKQYFLDGHTNLVTCLAVSRDGGYIVSGQTTYMGYKADVIVWNFTYKNRYGSHNIHKVKVEAVAFTARNDYVISLGGQDCRSVVVWDLKKKEPLCGSIVSPITGRHAYALCTAYIANDVFITGGIETLRVWKLNVANRKIIPTNVPMASLKREIICIQVDKNDEYCFCGTTSGDILKIRLNLQNYSGDTTTINPVLAFCLTRKINKKIKGDSPCYGLGITALAILKTGELLIGAGDGTVTRATEKPIETTVNMYSVVSRTAPSAKPFKTRVDIKLEETKRVVVMGPVSSLAVRGDGHQFFVGTKTCEIYRISLNEFYCELISTCHNAPVNDIVFPYDCSGVFATSSTEHIRVWNIETGQELLRITVPNMTCHSLEFMKDGRSIISGWNDGKIRTFTPETGKQLYSINEAHQRGVTAVIGTSDSQFIISGGGEGEVRLWQISPLKQLLHATMKEHRGPITCIRVKSNNRECVSASADGTCIIWDLKRFIRSQVIFANTLFKCVCYGPEECQIITSGTDRRISYWEVFDGSQIRELEGSLSGAINGMDISDDCEVFVTGGCEKLIKVWKYHEGEMTHIGKGHSGDISRLRISPDKKYIISVSTDGAILFWRFPFL